MTSKGEPGRLLSYCPYIHQTHFSFKRRCDLLEGQTQGIHDHAVQRVSLFELIDEKVYYMRMCRLEYAYTRPAEVQPTVTSGFQAGAPATRYRMRSRSARCIMRHSKPSRSTAKLSSYMSKSMRTQKISPLLTPHKETGRRPPVEA